MQDYHVESIIQVIADNIQKLTDQGVVTRKKKIALYGLDTFSFAMRTILSNMGYLTECYVSEDLAELTRFKRRIKGFSARYLNSVEHVIGVYSLEERLVPFDPDLIILSASHTYEKDKESLFRLGYCEGINLYQVYNWKNDPFQTFVKEKKRLGVKELQKIEKEILAYTDEVCQKLHLRYWVCGGTLLGTVRHKGFIPWDDDIDIFMPWKDYQRLAKEFQNNDRYVLVSPEKGDDYVCLLSKIMDKKTLVREDAGMIRMIDSVWLDIFPLAGVPEDLQERHMFFSDYTELEKKMWESFYRGNGNFKEYMKWYPKQRRFLENYDFDQSKFVGVLGTQYGEKDCTTREVYSRTLRMPFEDIEVNVPVGYREYLDNLYGKDWMQLPDESKRVSHHNMEAYWL